ncbi:MAG: putative Ig domain-containing protein [Gemmataceae bacterium]|nr:putative Ig domain-containing protein [Gemmataceae bacterium]
MSVTARRPSRLRAEALEDRTTPATFTVTNAADSGPGSLREAVGLANADPDADTIVINLPTLDDVRVVTVGDAADGPSALAVTTPITVQGSGRTIRGGGSARLFVVRGAGDLTLQNVAVAGYGVTGAAGADGRGGAILNLGGTVRVFGSTLDFNRAAGGPAGPQGGGSGLGGAIATVGGSVTVVGSGLTNNTAQGGAGTTAPGSGLGGAVYNDGGTVLIANTTVALNAAGGGDAGTDAGGGAGRGGGLYSRAGTATLVNVTFAGNTVTAGGGNPAGEAAGSAVYNFAAAQGPESVVRVGNSILAGPAGAAPVANVQAGGVARLTGIGPNRTTAAVDNRGGTVDGAAVAVGDSGLGVLNAPGVGPSNSFTIAEPVELGPAVDNGANALLTANNFGGAAPTTDQLGRPRVRGDRVDLGAVEGNSELLTLDGAFPLSPQAGDVYRAILSSTGPGLATDGTGASPGTASFAVVGGALPPGLSLVARPVGPNNFGVVTASVEGTPSQNGTFAFTVRATDVVPARNRTYTLDREFTVTVAGPTLGPETFPPATVGAAYNRFVGAQKPGRDGPVGVRAAVAVTAGALPPGLALTRDESGGNFLAGTPTAAGTYTFTLTATTDGGGTAAREYTFTVAPAGAASLTLYPPTLPGGTVGTSYSQAITAALPSQAVPASFAVTAGALPPGLTLSPNGNGGAVVGGTPTAAGTFTFTVTATDDANETGSREYTVAVAPAEAPTSPPPPPIPQPIPQPIAVGGSLNARAKVYTPTPATGKYEAAPAVTAELFGAAANVRTAVGDVDGDGYGDAVMVTGPGAPTRFAVVSGKDNATVLVPPRAPFEGSEDFTGGGLVTAADLDGDGRAEIVLTPDFLGGPRVVAFALRAGGAVDRVANFLGIEDINFRGGCRAALGDVNADGAPDLAVTAGFPGGPRAALWDGKTLLGTPTRLVADFFAFNGADVQTLRYGAFVAAGDVDGDGFADLIFGGGPGGAPRVFVLSGKMVAAGDVAGAQAAPVANFYVAGDDRDRDGVRVGATDADGDGKADVVAGSGERTAAGVRVYLGRDVGRGGEPAAFQDLDPFARSVLANGVFVG